jgi:hypothetical protein
LTFVALHPQMLSYYEVRMVTDKIKELSAAKARIEKLEQSIASGLQKELVRLPGKYGFGHVDEFIRALLVSAGKSRGRPANAKLPKIRRKRAKITDATRVMVKKMVGAGKTGSAIAKDLGISLPSVQNIKKDLGLVKGRKKSATKARTKAKKVRNTAVERPASPAAPIPAS